MMQKKKIFLILLPVFISSLIFFAESEVLFPWRHRAKMKDSMLSFQQDLDALTQKVTYEEESGFLPSLLAQRTVSVKSLQTLKSWSPHILSVFTFDENFSLTSATSEDFIDTPALLQKKSDSLTKKLSWKWLLTEKGFFLITRTGETGEISGYLALRIRPPAEPGILAGLSSADEKISYLYPKTSEKVEGSKYTIFWPQLGLHYIHYLPPQRPYESPAFFLIPLSLVLSLLLYFQLANPFQQRDTTRRQIEDALRRQSKTLEQLKNNLADTEHSFSTTDIKEKIVQGISEEVTDESGAFAADETKLSSSTKIIELSQDRKDFIWPSPASAEWNPEKAEIDETQLPERARLARRRTFSGDVKNLIDEIAEPEKREKTLSRVNEITSAFKSQLIEPWTTYLNEVYFDQVTLGEIIMGLEYINREMRADGVALMRYNPYIGCYETFATASLESGSQLQLYMLAEDPLIPSKEKEFTFTEVTSEIKENPYFLKRFMPDTLERMGMVLTISMHEHFLNSFLIAIFNKGNNLAKTSIAIRQKISKQLHEIMPAMKYFFQEQDKYLHTNQTREMIKELRLSTGHARLDLRIIHLYTELLINKNIFRTIRSEVSQVLSESDRLIFNSPNHLLLLTRQEDLSKIEAVFKRLIPDIVMETTHFPDLGKNFYMYL